jgi:hypothetical protein
MRKRPITNLTASVRQRLLNLSKSTGDPFELVLTRYALERFLYSESGSDRGNCLKALHNAR